jgi:TetR/AcrR family transcriptional repressor of nem operon
MPRSSKQDAAKHRQQVIEGASELFRERGIDGVNVGELMGAAGLTHGGFYRHFASKDELAGLAAAHAITTQAETLGDERAFIEGYLSPEHRDDVAHGCVVSALGPELARADEPVREAFVEAYRAFVERFGDDEQALAKLSTMVGALVISRVTKGHPLSDEVLAAARGALLP